MWGLIWQYQCVQTTQNNFSQTNAGLCDGTWISHVTMYDNPLLNRKYKHICDVLEWTMEKCSKKKRCHNDIFEKKLKIKESNDYLKSIYRYFRKLAVYFCWIPS